MSITSSLPATADDPDRPGRRCGAGGSGRLNEVEVEVEMVVVHEPLTIRVPDLVVTHTALYESNPPRLDAADVLLAVEILCDGTRRVDRVLKLSEYAEAGIPRYWIVDLGSGPGDVRILGIGYRWMGSRRQDRFRPTGRDRPLRTPGQDVPTHRGEQ
ncbi:MAG TPA: Uma2 family endonuclease [Pseudonocardia sp.]|nr:Uma2 family endonuclease [Pseudonocardia sp.]